ncbi:MAG: glutathione S-transferase N-terminal domain-containing protein [Alphaproteobacteria bacterium]|nr:glutathione S-transferase N-terminal domain-containing protein [Alphaproteobacteria bacterium]MDP6587966.1 glutathione S-transferase N-terminal domain-containing protein [Alphaproteobacteria bacterium]MDP6817785.1 glutathione S-transferase N-terminal domain-containing protein [Alphaproteobacteria bacterium]
MARVLYELQGRADRRLSPYCWRTRMALRHKELEAEFIPVQFGQKDRIAFSGQELVPVLQDEGGRVIHDSWAIADHLESTYPERPSLFGGEAGRAGARFFNGWVDRALHPAMIRLILRDIHDGAIAEVDRPYFRASREARFGMALEDYCDPSAGRIKAFRGLLEPVRLALEEAPYLGGAAPLYADHILFGTCKFVELCSPLVIFAEDDPIYEWYGRMLALFDGYGASDGAAGGPAGEPE